MSINGIFVHVLMVYLSLEACDSLYSNMGTPTHLSNASSVKIRNKHNFAICQPIITNLVSLPMSSASTYHLKAFPESQGVY